MHIKSRKLHLCVCDILSMNIYSILWWTFHSSCSSQATEQHKHNTWLQKSVKCQTVLKMFIFVRTVLEVWRYWETISLLIIMSFSLRGCCFSSFRFISSYRDRKDRNKWNGCLRRNECTHISCMYYRITEFRKWTHNALMMPNPFTVSFTMLCVLMTQVDEWSVHQCRSVVNRFIRWRKKKKKQSFAHQHLFKEFQYVFIGVIL